MQTIRAPRGNQISCKGWLQEAAMRMVMNNLDPDVAEKPEDLIVYGGIGKAARNWESYHAIIQTLQQLENDETMLVQSGKPVGVFKTHPDAPRVILANSNIVPHWATWEKFREYEKLGLIMYGQMTAGSWIYIGTQGILQGTYETFGACAKKHFNGTLKGTITLTAGLGGMGGAQPLSVTMNDGVAIVVEVDPHRIQRRLDTRYCDIMVKDLDKAWTLAQEYKKKGEAKSIGLLGNAAEVLPEMLKKNYLPDIVTDQTSAHDELNGYVPTGISVDQLAEFRKSKPDEYIRRAMDSMAVHVQAMLDFQKRGAIVFDYGNNIRGQALKQGISNAFDFPGFVPAFIRPLFCEGQGPFRWVALSGDPEDIYTTDRALIEAFPEKNGMIKWLTSAKSKIQFQGLPARICWLGYTERDKAGLIFNELVRTGKVKAPIVIGRDHLDCGSVASPNRETEAMKDGSDAIADWPLLNFAINAINGATWVSLHHGGGVGIGYSIHAGMVIVADGTEEAAKRLQRVLIADPGMGILRHVDAGYDEAIAVAKKTNVKIPMMK